MDLRQALQVIGIRENPSASELLNAFKLGLKNAKTPQERRLRREAYNVITKELFNHTKKPKKKAFFGVPAIFKPHDNRDQKPKPSTALSTKPKGDTGVSTKTRNRFKEAFEEGVGTGRAKANAAAFAKRLLNENLTQLFKRALLGSAIGLMLAPFFFFVSTQLDSPFVGITGYPNHYYPPFLARKLTHTDPVEEAWYPYYLQCLDDGMKLQRLGWTEYDFVDTPHLLERTDQPEFPEGGYAYSGRMYHNWEDYWEDYTRVFREPTPKFSTCVVASKFVSFSHTWNLTIDRHRIIFTAALTIPIILIVIVFSGLKALKFRREHDEFVNDFLT